MTDLMLSLRRSLALLLWLPMTLHAETFAVASAPAFSLKTPQGETVNFPEAAQGRPTVLMFWPSWCPFSRALQPYVQAIWEDYRSAGVNVWTINIKEDKDPVQVMKDRGLSFPLLVEGDAVANAYHLRYTPWLVVVDGSNRIIYTRPPNPPTPIDTAKDVRTVLNKMLGDKAVPLPASYPKPYDLHLKSGEPQNSRLAPKPIEASEWKPWVQRYLSTLSADEAVTDLPAKGPLADGKAAIALAREVWSARYGPEATLAQAPYRAYRQGTLWVVLGNGDGALGSGFVLVANAGTGRVIRVTTH